MFERFSDRARQVVVDAQHEARTLKHNYIGTEHLLLGLLKEPDGASRRALNTLGVRLEETRAQVAEIIGQGDEVTTGQIPFTPRAKKVLELALREALFLGHDYIGSEHILLGIVRVNDGVAPRILLDHGADADRVRDEVIRELGITRPPDYDARMHSERRKPRRSQLAPYVPLIFGTLVLFAAGIGFGLFIGWKIWG
jgi:ATP-dependent Clp protease ATP-binding subunit ClpC